MKPKSIFILILIFGLVFPMQTCSLSLIFFNTDYWLLIFSYWYCSRLFVYWLLIWEPRQIYIFLCC